MARSSSSVRRDGKNAYYEGLDAETECPYNDLHFRKCWLDGWYSEASFEDKRVAQEDGQYLQEEQIKESFRENFDANYLQQMQNDYEAGKVSSIEELLFMAFATGYKACLDS